MEHLEILFRIHVICAILNAKNALEVQKINALNVLNLTFSKIVFVKNVTHYVQNAPEKMHFNAKSVQKGFFYTKQLAALFVLRVLFQIIL